MGRVADECLMTDIGQRQRKWLIERHGGAALCGLENRIARKNPCVIYG
jgi:hypothetical protein